MVKALLRYGDFFDFNIQNDSRSICYIRVFGPPTRVFGGLCRRATFGWNLSMSPSKTVNRARNTVKLLQHETLNFFSERRAFIES